MNDASNPVLVDTNIWVEHFQSSNDGLVMLLESSRVMMHSSIIGEIACGALKNRKNILELLQTIPSVESLFDEELLEFIERNHLHGVGIGWIDVQLLASCKLSGAKLWTHDRKLDRQAQRLHISWRD